MTLGGETAPRSSGAPGHERGSAPAGFQGRAEQLLALESALENSRAGSPIAVVVQGESGIGKSALCAQFVEAHPEALVLSGRCYERDLRQFNALDGVVESLGRYLAARGASERPELPAADLALIGTAFPSLRHGLALAGRPAPADPEKLGAAICTALRSTFAALAVDRPLVLCVDDLQWADVDSVGMLAELLAPGGGLAVLFLGALRSRPGAEQVELRALSARLGRELEPLPLGPLSAPEAEALVKSLKPTLTPEARAAIVREGAGHPLFLHELALHGDDGAPQLEDALGARVAALSSRARQVVELLAVAGGRVRDTTLAAAVGVSAAELRSVADELRRKRLLQWVGPRSECLLDTWHDRVREAVLARLGESDRRAHHQALAAALEQEGIAELAPERLVPHLLGAGHQSRASELALRAAERARAALAFDRASELYHVALECSATSGEGERALRLAYAECAALAGRGDEAAQACLDAKRGAGLEARIELQRQAAEHLLGSGHFEQGLETMRAVLDEIGEDWPRHSASLIAAVAIGRLRIKVRGYAWLRRPASPRELMRLRAYRAVGVGLMNISPMLAAVFHSRYVLLALDCGPAECAAEALAMEAMYQNLLGGTSHLPLLASARAIATEVKAERETRHAVDAGGGLIRIQDGELRGGADELKVALEGWRSAERSPWLINRGVLGLLHALERLGALGELGPFLDETLRSCAHRGDRLVEETATRAACSVFLARGETDALRRRLASAPWVPSEGGYSATMFLDLYARAGLSLYAGGHGWAELSGRMDEYASSFLSRTRLYRADYLWLRGRLALADGSPDTLDEARRCARTLLDKPQPHHVVWGQLLEAAVLSRTGQPDRARLVLRGVGETARRLSMDLYAHVAARRLGALLGGADGEQRTADADTLLLRMGVANPSRFCDVIAPGFTGRPR